MEQVSRSRNASGYLYPPIDPYDQRMLDVGDGHRIYVEQCGNPLGIPVVVFHGGPGGGCSPAMRRYFDPKEFRIILFDQRGCGRSRPHAGVENNTTHHLVADAEMIRQTLGIDRWVLFGGSWGATLALVYAQAHPDRTAYLALRGVFLMTQGELDWFYGGGGAARFFPDHWSRFVGLLPEEERGNVIEAFHTRLFSGDIPTETRFARAWASWENALASIENDGPGGEAPADYARAFARLENHYFVNRGFLERDGQILEDMPLISHIPGTVVQGRYDMICPPISAWRLTERWSRGELRMAPMAGHALSEPTISAELVRTTRAIARSAIKLGF
ncbi:prolyl aminopeptidase [Roseicyclus sp. F158]|uniref:Proline iminopeptidase n=1 Tax=Tropicimonas omnivorans TaxID=3075590 RepID=A0ABU3DCZ4_9RHOB|nr:prolyl aminopeptidase [Roseicyclus sp. F158]MDT0681581.1 prolyl aminopeptidase [Roseicyclus sp. F158]